MTVVVERAGAAIRHLMRNGGSERYRVGDASLRIRLVKGKTLSGEEQGFVDQIGDRSIKRLFDKTPYTEKPSDVVCPHFLELKWANGGFFDCRVRVCWYA
jgi:spore photoproduct lyase